MRVVPWQVTRGALTCHLASPVRSEQIILHSWFIQIRNLTMGQCINIRSCVKHLMATMLCPEHKHSWFMNFQKDREDDGWPEWWSTQKWWAVLNLLQQINTIMANELNVKEKLMADLAPPNLFLCPKLKFKLKMADLSWLLTLKRMWWQYWLLSRKLAFPSVARVYINTVICVFGPSGTIMSEMITDILPYISLLLFHFSLITFFQHCMFYAGRNINPNGKSLCLQIWWRNDCEMAW
jgi:hypothetical protein